MKKIKIVLHGIALLNFLYVIFGFGSTPEYVTQQTVIAIWQLKFMLISIYFELMALGVSDK